MDESVGQLLEGKYRLDHLLGQGGMGTVYRATHLGTGRVVAVKVIAPRFGQDAAFVGRFRREARAAGRLRHPNVVDVTDFGFAEVPGGRLAYLVMEYLDGCSLAEVLKDEGKLPLPWVADILDQVGSAVHEAHQQGIIHRDLKPDNLWLEPDRRGGFRVKVLDFGLATLARAEPVSAHNTPHRRDPSVAGSTAAVSAAAGAPFGQKPATEDQETQAVGQSAGVADPAVDAGADRKETLTQAGQLLGTPLYMSPEQCRGKALDARSDVYSLAVIAYQMLAGAPPFTGDAWEVIEKHLNEVPQPLRKGPGGVPRSVSEWIASALDKDPEKRPASAAAFAAAFCARAERPLAFLQRIQTLLAERLPLFLRISFLAHLPLLILGWGLLGLSTVLPSSAQRASDATTALPVLVSVLLLLAVLGTTILCDTVVIQALVAPMRAGRLGPVVRGLRTRVPVFLRVMAPPFLFLAAFSSLLLATSGRWRIATAIVILFALFILRTRVDAVWFTLQVVSLEGLQGRAAFDRSRALATQSRRNLPSLQGTSYAIGLGGVVVFMAALAIGEHASVMGALGQWGATCAAGGLLSVLAMPLLTVPFALLYYRTREAAGEPLAEILERFEKAILPPDSWQVRMKDRFRSEIHSRM